MRRRVFLLSGRQLASGDDLGDSVLPPLSTAGFSLVMCSLDRLCAGDRSLSDPIRTVEIGRELSLAARSAESVRGDAGADFAVAGDDGFRALLA